MTATAATLRQHFPEFADETTYPDTNVEFWLGIAAKLVNESRWGELTDLGQELFAAHKLVLEFQAQASADTGSAPGTAQGGVVSGKSVDKVSVNYDTGAAAELDAGHWNMTTFGKRYIRLARMMGAGPIQVGVASGYDPLSSATAWSGPDTNPGWFGS